MKKITRIFYFALLIVSIIVLGMAIMVRHKTEVASDTVEITLDYKQFSELAKQMDMPVVDLFRRLKDYGYPSVTLEEETFKSLAEAGESLEYHLYKNLTENISWKQFYPTSAIQYLEENDYPYNFVVRTNDSSLFEQLMINISARYEEDIYKVFEGKNSIGEYSYVLVF